MARLADLGLSSRGNAMALKPGGVVAQERARKEFRKLRANMARSAVGAFEVALVTLQTLAHGRRAHLTHRWVEHSGVARDALSVDLRHRKMALVRKQDTIGSVALDASES
jgi:hypothetical protein